MTELSRIGGTALGEALARWARGPLDPIGPLGLGGALERIGLALTVEEEPARSGAGFAAEREGMKLRVSRVNPVSAAGRAGLRPGDQIERIVGAAPEEAWAERIAGRAPGGEVVLDLARGARLLRVTLALESFRPLACHLVERPATPRVTALREALLGR